jgi:hypothetical protein
MPFRSGWKRVIVGNTGKTPWEQLIVANRYVLDNDTLVAGEVLKTELARMPIKDCDLISRMNWLT